TFLAAQASEVMGGSKLMIQKDEIREAVGVFDDQNQLDAAVAELEVTAFPRQDISVLSQQQVQERFGDDTRTEWFEDNPAAPRSVPLRPEERHIGAGVIIAAS